MKPNRLVVPIGRLLVIQGQVLLEIIGTHVDAVKSIFSSRGGLQTHSATDNRRTHPHASHHHHHHSLPRYVLIGQSKTSWSSGGLQVIVCSDGRR